MGINIYLLDVPLVDFVFMEPLLCTIDYMYNFLDFTVDRHSSKK